MNEIEAVIDPGDPDQTSMLSEVDKSETKAEAAVTMAMYGASPTDIAKTLNYSSPYRAKMAVERALASAANSPDDREKVRKLIDKRLNRLLAAHMPKALDPAAPDQLAHSARALAIIDRQARLHGVDAPQQLTVTVNDQYIQEYLEAIVPLAAAQDKAIEFDILEEAEAADGQP